MLILAKITKASAGGYADYLEGKARASELGDYYLKDGERVEAPGRWAQGAEQFALDPSRAVSAEQLHRLMDVRRPDSGEDLRRVGGGGTAVSAIDATFSAPKSVSSVWALASPELRTAVEQAHETAIDRALSYATQQVPMLRRRVGSDNVVHEKAVGLVATSWRHSTARAVEDQIPDPQLHSHVLLRAAIRQDQEVVAIDSRSWLVHQREVGAAYRSELARELHQLGFGIDRGTGRGGRYFEIASVPQALTDRWSSRHHQVQTAITQRLADQQRELKEMVAAGGPQAADAGAQLKVLTESGLSPAQERMMGTITRNAKLPVTAADLDTEWRRTAAALGFSRERVEVLRHTRGPELTAASDRDVLDALTEFDATFPARDARAVALERSAGIPTADALQQLVGLREAEQILVLADGSGTTRAHRGKERTVVAVLERLSDARVEPIAAGLAEAEAQRLDRELALRGGRLSVEQREAIMLACSDRPLVIIEGQAGTGKSTALTGIARAHQASGREIVITSTAGLAAERLSSDLQAAGVTCQAYSTQALESAITHGQIELGANTTVIHDEAALASTDEQLAVLHAVEGTGARMIAVGDPRQNQPVGAGGLWEHAETLARDGEAHVELTVNQRALDPADRRDQARFRNGQAEHAIRSYAARDHIHLDQEPRRVEDQALEAAQTDRSTGLETMVIVQSSNEHLDQLNARAQAIRIQNGELGENSLPVPGRPYELHAGDEVQIRRTLQRPDDRPLRNGTSAEVTDIDPDQRTVSLRVEDRDSVVLTEQEIEDADLRLAYAQHPFPAQGQTTDTAHLLITDHSTREGAYVGLTRARQRTDIYSTEPAERDTGTDRLPALAAQMSRSEPEIPSIAVPLRHERQTHRAAQDERVAGASVQAEVEEVRELNPGLDEAVLMTERDDEPVLEDVADSELAALVERTDGTDRQEMRTTGQLGTSAEPEAPSRTWLRARNHGMARPAIETVQERDRGIGYEP